MNEFCQGCGRDFGDGPANSPIPIREDDTGVELTVCSECVGQLEGATIL